MSGDQRDRRIRRYNPEHSMLHCHTKASHSPGLLQKETLNLLDCEYKYIFNWGPWLPNRINLERLWADSFTRTPPQAVLTDKVPLFKCPLWNLSTWKMVCFKNEIYTPALRIDGLIHSVGEILLMCSKETNLFHSWQLACFTRCSLDIARWHIITTVTDN